MMGILMEIRVAAVKRVACRARYLVFLCMAFAAVPASGVEWVAEPSVTLREEYNDNYLLTPAPYNAVWGTILSPALKLSRRTEVSETSANARLNFNRYTGENNLDRTDQYYTLNSSVQSERNLLAGDFSFTRDSTLYSELAETGIVQTRSQRSRLSLAPSWTRMLSERNSLRLGYQYDKISYQGGTTSLADYTNQSASTNWLHQWSEKDLITTGVYYARFETANAGYQADTIGIQAGLTHDFSETLQGNFRMGVRNTKSTVEGFASRFVEIFPGFFVPVQVPQTTTTTSRGMTLNAQLQKRFETMTIHGNISREQNPTGNSTLVETDRLGVAVTRTMSEKLSATASGNIYRSRYIGEVVNAPDRQYYEIALNFNWRMTERWRLDSGYRYARAEYKSNNTSPDSNLVFAGLRYDWPRKSISR